MINYQIRIVRLSQMIVDSDTIADIQLEAVMLFAVLFLLAHVVDASLLIVLVGVFAADLVT